MNPSNPAGPIARSHRRNFAGMLIRANARNASRRQPAECSRAARSHRRKFTGMLIHVNRVSGRQPADYRPVARSHSRNVTGMLICANPRKASGR